MYACIIDCILHLLYVSKQKRSPYNKYYETKFPSELLSRFPLKNSLRKKTYLVLKVRPIHIRMDEKQFKRFAKRSFKE